MPEIEDKKKGQGSTVDPKNLEAKIAAMIASGDEKGAKMLLQGIEATSGVKLAGFANQLEADVDRADDDEKKKGKTGSTASSPSAKSSNSMNPDFREMGPDGKPLKGDGAMLLGAIGVVADAEKLAKREVEGNGHKHGAQEKDGKPKGITPEALAEAKKLLKPVGAKDIAPAKEAGRPSKNPDGVKPPEKAPMPRLPGGGKS